jgi:hypothetical protein
MKRIAFVIPKLKFGACGVSDYSLRMATTLATFGYRCSLLAIEPIACRESTDGVALRTYSRAEATEHDVLCLQFVPNLKKEGRRMISQMADSRHPRIHLMIHEFFRISSTESPLNIKERIKSRCQLHQLRSLIRKSRPNTISTSNEHYQKTLLDYGIIASVSPMPGTIPCGTGDLGVGEIGDVVNWFLRANGEYIWVIFGSLYTEFWDSRLYFQKIAGVASHNQRPHRWVVCGHQSAANEARFRSAASEHGFGDALHFTGPLPGRSIDWLMRNADASLSGTDWSFWEKSTGVLVAVERNIPVYFPRNEAAGHNMMDVGLYTNLETLLANTTGFTTSRPAYQGAHSPQGAASRLLEILTAGENPSLPVQL